MKHRRHSATAPVRSAFTLVEVIVALALSLLLMGTVYNAMDIHWKYTSAGQEEVQHAQLARALMRKIEADLRCVLYIPPPPITNTTSSSGSGSSGGGSGGGSSGGGSGSGGASATRQTAAAAAASAASSGSTQTLPSTPATPPDPYTAATTGLIGTNQTLLIYISKPLRQVDSTLLTDGTASQMYRSDLQAVAYFMAGSAGGTLTGMASAQLAGAPAPAGSEGPSNKGLARLAGDRMAIKTAISNQSLGTAAGQTKLLAPEVVAVQFQYFNGSMWMPSWDSVALCQMPRAVEIRLEFAAKESTLGSSSSPTARQANQVHRLVVPLTASMYQMPAWVTSTTSTVPPTMSNSAFNP